MCLRLLLNSSSRRNRVTKHWLRTLSTKGTAEGRDAVWFSRASRRAGSQRAQLIQRLSSSCCPLSCAPAAPLTPPPRGLALGSSTALLPGLTRLRVFGYPQAVDGTPTPTDGTYLGAWDEPGTGRWLKLQGLVMPGHSGGPCLDEAGAVVAWNVRNRLQHDQARPEP